LLLYQEEDSFLFNSDSHYLYDFISKLNPKGDVLDVGSGCGILGLLVARDFKVNLTSIDIQKNSYFLTRQNALINSLECEALCGNFLEYKFNKKFDFIISNPPYYSSKVIKSKNQRLYVSRYAENMELKAFIKKAKTLLKNIGHLIFCYDAKEIDNIITALKELKLNPVNIRFVYGNINKQSHLVFIHARASSNSPTTIHPPLIATTDGEFSDEVRSIYQKTRTYSIKCSL
jgi:tRNA1(Val) A37 N6-methylase TrmN6